MGLAHPQEEGRPHSDGTTGLSASPCPMGAVLRDLRARPPVTAGWR